MNDDDLDYEVDNIINQIKNQNNSLKQVEKEYPKISPEDIDQFIIDNVVKIITDASKVISANMELAAHGGLTDKETEASATLLNAVNSSIEILQKRKIADNKNKTQKEVVQMNIDAKQSKEEESNVPRLEMSRDELLKFLTSSKEEKKEDDIIDV